MELILQRTVKHKGYTAGKLWADDELFCDTLEPTWRDIGWSRPGRKVAGCTAIPSGRYPVVITRSADDQWLPLLLHVPLFKDVRIRAGSTVADTDGDILVGISRRPGTLTDSTLWVQRLKRLIVEVKERGEGVWITVR